VSGVRPVLFLLHALGGSARSWDPVVERLGERFDCAALDLPGFGDAGDDPRTSVAEMLDRLADAVRARAPDAWMVVGHSMGGKLATLLTARAEAGEVGLSGLAGTVLVAASPPSPEPMEEARRARMLGWVADGPISEADARAFVEANIAGPLPASLMDAAVADVRRSAPHAWTDWLERGAREDWTDRLPERLATPVLVVAGAADGDLGQGAQARLNAARYARATAELVAGAAHLIPLERPDALAALIAAHWERVRHRVLPPAFARALAADRANARTRAALLARLDDPADDAPSCLNDAQRRVLSAMVARVLPGVARADGLARRLDANLAGGVGDGWRFADLPPDAEAWAAGLDTLDRAAGGFAGLSAAEQDAWLERLADGGVEGAPGGVEGGAGHALTSAQGALWFEDVRAEIVRHHVAHPATMARIGYSGVLSGGEGRRIRGYGRTGADDPEGWEPAAAGAAA